jgi:sigma-B regulation protein RsbQ
MDVLLRNNVQTFGDGQTPMVFVHGYGCDQNMWRFLTPYFATDHQTVLLDLIGFGRSDLASYERSKYSNLEGHARDIVEIAEALDLQNAVLVGHSVSSMIAVLAAKMAPDRFSRLVLVAPSPCYLNDGDYAGGFDKSEIDELIEFLDLNFLGWSRQMAPPIMGSAASPEMVEELTNSFCRTDPDVAKHFGRVTFLSDHRGDIPGITIPTLIVQVAEDMIAPRAVGEWMHDHIPGSSFSVIDTSGHCPHMTSPSETANAIRSFLEKQSAEA